MTLSSDDPLSPQHITWLRRLVTLLTAVMIIGMATIAFLMMKKLDQNPVALADLPADINAQDVQSYSWTPDHVVIITISGELRIYSRASGALIKIENLE